MSSIIQP